MNYISYKNNKIAYLDTGKGAAVVLLHGYLENSSMWDAFIPDFSKKYRVITIDLLGHGETDCMGYIHTMEDMADAVYAVVSQLRLRKIILAGHSMGGYVALAFAELYPDMVKGLVLQNSNARADNEERRANRDRAIKAVKQNYTGLIRMSIANLFSEQSRERLTAEIEVVMQQALKTPLQGVIAALEGMKVRPDREVLLHFANYPILLVLGEKDPVMNYNDNKDQGEAPNVTLVTYPDGHMSHIENRELLLKNLLAFFKMC